VGGITNVFLHSQSGSVNKGKSPLKIDSLDEFVPLVRKLCRSGSFGHAWIFRGQSCPRAVWPLIPKAGRAGFFDPNKPEEQKWEYLERYGYTQPLDMAVFSEWKRRGAICTSNLPEDEWECLALAQHHGLATRLLDWTRNPLVALFFAVWEFVSEHGAVYAIPSGGLVTAERFQDIRRIMTFEPRPFHRRIEAQQAVFTFHPEPCRPIEPSLMFKTMNPVHNEFGTDVIEIYVPSDRKRLVLEDLAAFGITRSSLFPDLDGLAMELNYLRRQYITERLKGWPVTEEEARVILAKITEQSNPASTSES
jgi:hypothetical protein